MMNDTSTLPDDPQKFKQIVHRYEHEIDLLREQIRLLSARIFGKKNEKSRPDDASVQLPLFDMPELEVEPEKEEVEIPGHTRQKAGRKKLPESLPRVEVVHERRQTAMRAMVFLILCRVSFIPIAMRTPVASLWKPTRAVAKATKPAASIWH